MRARANADLGMVLATTYEESANDSGAGHLEGSTGCHAGSQSTLSQDFCLSASERQTHRSRFARPAVVEANETLTSIGVLPTRNDSSSPTNDILEPGVLFRLDCAAGIEGDAGVMVAIAPSIHLDDPTDNIEGRQHSDRSPRDASESPQAKAGTARRWFSRAMLWMVEFVVGGLLQTGGR